MIPSHARKVSSRHQNSEKDDFVEAAMQKVLTKVNVPMLKNHGRKCRWVDK